MGIKKTVFQSSAERKNYYKLARAWGKDYLIYHNLPFLNLFTPDNILDWSNLSQSGTSSPKIELTDIERNRLKKTSIDYSLCNVRDEPIVCIDFDGLYDGVNIGTSYLPGREPPDDWRDTIMNLKLKVAHGSLFPYFIVGDSQFEDLSRDLQVTIVDGIVGEVLASKQIEERFAAGFDPESDGWPQEDFDRLHQREQDEIVQDWVTGVEVEAVCSNNPIVKKGGQLHLGLGGEYSSWRVHYRMFPETHSSDPVERARSLQSALYVGATVTLCSHQFGDIEKTIMLPNFQTPHYRGGFGLAEEIAEVLALEKLQNLVKKSKQDPLN